MMAVPRLIRNATVATEGEGKAERSGMGLSKKPSERIDNRVLFRVDDWLDD